MRRFFIAYNFETYQGRKSSSSTRMTLEKLEPKVVSQIIAHDLGYKSVKVTAFKDLTETVEMLADSELIHPADLTPIPEDPAPKKKRGRKKRAA